MSDQTVDPAAPAEKAIQESTENSPSKEVSAPKSVPSFMKQLDHILLRLNKLISSPSGLSSFLSTFNYTLYILAYIQTTHSPAISRRARALLVLLRNSTSSSPTLVVASGAAAKVPAVAALAGLLSSARTTLRLLGLFPLYAWLRSLLQGRKAGTDPVQHNIALVQCVSYIVYQALENVCVLADNGVVPSSFVARINRGDPTTGRVYLWAYRAWLAGVACDFLKLAREAQTEKQRREERGYANIKEQEEDRKKDAAWWNEFIVASAWFPMALNYSTTKGLPGWNLGVLGLTGLIAGAGRIQDMWHATL